MPKYKVYWVERYVSEVEADSHEDAEANADYDNGNYIGAETEGIEEIKDATPMDRGDGDENIHG